MKQIHISTASDEQVRRFALMVGVDLLPTDGPDTVISKLRMVWQGDGITVADEPDAPGALTGELRTAPEDRQPGESSHFAAVARATRLGSSDSSRDPRVILNVQKVRVGNEVSNSDVPVGVNGVAFQLKTGIPVDVPYRVYEALNNAQREEITHDDQGEVVSAMVHAYPFNVMEMPSKAEVKAWREEIDRAEAA
jgi:hypothetical protein